VGTDFPGPLSVLLNGACNLHNNLTYISVFPVYVEYTVRAIGILSLLVALSQILMPSADEKASSKKRTKKD